MLTQQREITLKDLLKQSGITQKTLAKRLGVARTYISETVNTPIEKLSWRMIQRICSELGFKASILIQ